MLHRIAQRVATAVDRMAGRRRTPWPFDRTGAFATWRRIATHLLFPPRCVLCDADLGQRASDILVCASCLRRVVPSTWRGCPRCGGAIQRAAESTSWCGRCRTARYAFDGVVALGDYGDELRRAILNMKRDTSGAIAMAMARLLHRERGAEIGSHTLDVAMPVPMYWRRRWRRGVNSPETVARFLAERLAIPFSARAIARSRATRPQSTLSPKQRLKNVSNAFRIRKGYDVRRCRVLLVDDILTTGATCSEVARILKQAGAEQVLVAVLARAAPQSA